MPEPKPTATHAPADELDVLFPDVDLTVRDPDTGAAVELTVREFRFLEGLRAQATARPFTEALAEVIGTADESALDAPAIAGVLAEHGETWLALTAAACDRDPEWLARLRDVDGDAVSEAMWSANGGFFMRRVVAAVAAARKGVKRGSRSPSSSTPSSAQDTGAGTPTSPTD